MRTRQGLWVGMGVMLVAIAFGAGYGVYPLLHDARNAGEPRGAIESRGGQSAAERPAEGQSRDLGVFWEAWRLLDSNFYGEMPNDTERARGAVRGMVESFGDPYTVYVEPQPRELERDRLRGSFGGIGAGIELTGTRILLHPFKGQPADLAGVLDGDELRRVDAITVTIAMSSDEVVSLVRGPIGSTVNLGLRRGEGGAARDVEVQVERAEIRTPSIEYSMLEAESGEAVGYLRHMVFSERSAEEMEEAIATLEAQGARRFIWDLRGNPGGLVDAAVATVDIWLGSGAIVIEEHADGSSRVFSATAGGAGVDAPLTVVVDKASASASEIAAGALQDSGRARIVGERTFGKGSVQLIYELADQSSLHVTNAQWFTPNHRQIQGNGLAPDIAVEAGVDPLPAAVAAVQKELPQRAAASQ